MSLSRIGFIHQSDLTRDGCPFEFPSQWLFSGFLLEFFPFQEFVSGFIVSCRLGE